MQHENQPLYIDTQTAANLLGISRSSLEKYRHFRDSKGPPFVVFGRGAIRYHVPRYWNGLKPVPLAMGPHDDRSNQSHRPRLV